MKSICIFIIIFATYFISESLNLNASEEINSEDFTPVTGWEMMERFGMGITFADTTEARVWPWETRNVENHEDAWRQPRLRRWHFESAAARGFDSYRMCVSWTPRMDENHQIDPAFMDRIQEITDWALDAGFYVIMNTHHEEELYWLIRDNEFEAAEAHLNAIWTQVSERFANYSERVIFEILNEPNLKEFYHGDGPWISHTHRGVDRQLAETVNRLNDSALEVIRNSGGNNDRRVVVLGIPGGSPEAIPTLRIPDDPYVMVGVFGYYGTNITDETLRYMQNLINAGVGVFNKEDNTAFDIAAHPTFDALTHTQRHYARLAEMGVPSFWFAGCLSLYDFPEERFFNRVTGEWNESTIM
ncbi:MAG: glycoside hydrolase family 5 protein [Clostridiales bacterium]|jgi:hypothetical protein|nr:glycoside hydrolase family 5 protein [Clostridiales bacterium]